VGYSVPEEYGADRPDRRLGDCAIVSVHCHDDLGLAVANSSRIKAGARQISAPSTASASVPATARSKKWS
jgi:2-isopropylmalate synthase